MGKKEKPQPLESVAIHLQEGWDKSEVVTNHIHSSSDCKRPISERLGKCSADERMIQQHANTPYRFYSTK